jgi:hypothetical protein
MRNAALRLLGRPKLDPWEVNAGHHARLPGKSKIFRPVKGKRK